MPDAISLLNQRIATEIDSDGPMRFSRFMQLALYDPALGFYSHGGQAGRRSGDFITSVEAGPLFGAVIAKRLDSLWHSLGSPSEFLVTEAGAGVGTLYRTVHAAAPECFGALTWTLVEQSEHLRAQHDSLPADAWSSRSSLPDARQHLVLANELLDNLPFDIAQRTRDGWAPVLVERDSATPSGLGFVAGNANDRLAHLVGLAPGASIGSQVPVMATAAQWVASARSIADEVLAFDYGASTADLAQRDRAGWLRTYQAQQRGSDPLLLPGTWDVTADVAWDQLGGEPLVSTQAEWLDRTGIDALVDAARATWTERAAIGDLAAMVARSAITEAEALTAPDGLGGFLVFEWSESGPQR